MAGAFYGERQRTDQLATLDPAATGYSELRLLATASADPDRDWGLTITTR